MLCKCVNIVLSRQHETQKAYLLILAGDADTQKKQEIPQRALNQGPIYKHTVMREILDCVFGVVVVPGNAVVLQENK